MNTIPPPAGEQPKTPRQRYREAKARRQTKVLGGTIAGMAIAASLALLGLAGVLPLPFGNEFTTKVRFADIDDTPCPTEGVTAPTPGNTLIQILNASDQAGLAGTVGERLQGVGFIEPKTSNSSEPFRGNVQIEVGLDTVDQGYSIARYFEAPVRIRLAKMAPDNVTIVLGEGFRSVMEADDIKKIMEDNQKLKGLDQCRPVDPKQIEEMSQLSLQSGMQSGAQSGVQSGTETDEDAAE